jgi:hypothetical protein
MASRSSRFPWIGVSAIAACVVVIAAVCLRIPEAEGESGLVEKGDGLPAMGLSRINVSMSADLLAEQIAAYDPAPMFVPSAMNSSDPFMPADEQPGAVGPFEGLPPILVKAGPVRFPPLVPIPRSPIDGLHLTERVNAPLALARADTAGRGLPARAAKIEVIHMENGDTALLLDLPSPMPLLGGDWQPLELTGAITRSGQVGRLVVTASSGSDEIDEFFLSHLQKTVRVGVRLKAGFYVFRAGP